MTKEEWELVGQFVKDVVDRFDEQEKRIKNLENQLEKLIDDLEEDWIFEQMNGVREAK
jgi:hypothetical protein